MRDACVPHAKVLYADFANCQPEPLTVDFAFVISSGFGIKFTSVAPFLGGGFDLESRNAHPLPDDPIAFSI
jgi:hypothetical protein